MTAGADLFPALLACGLCCPLGATFRETARAYRSGTPAFAKERALVAADGLPPTLAEAIPLLECRDYVERLNRLFDAAMADCEAQAPPPPGGWPLRLVVGNEVPDRFPLNHLADDLLKRQVGVVSSVEIVAGGPAEALSELGYAAKAVLDGAADTLLVGALESRINPFVLDSLTLDERLLLRGNPWGCIPGEACVLVLVGHPELERPALGQVLAIFRAQERADLAIPQDVVGRGTARAFEMASGFQVPDRLIVDLNGERWRAQEFGFAVARIAGMGAGSRIAELAADPEAPTLQLGDCGTAMGLLLPALALAHPPRRTASGPIAMVSLSSRSGLRAVGFIERTEVA